MYALLIVVHVIASLILILVILLQAGRGGGISESFGMSSTQTFFGTSAAKFLQRATSVCAVIFLLTCLSLAALSTQRSRSLMEKQRVKKAIEDLVSASPASGGQGGSAIDSAKSGLGGKEEPTKTEPLKQEAPKAE